MIPRSTTPQPVTTLEEENCDAVANYGGGPSGPTTGIPGSARSGSARSGTHNTQFWPTSANTSAKRHARGTFEALPPPKRPRRTPDVCGLCGTTLQATVPRHQCRQHHDRHLCVRCSINASAIYPDSTFDLIQPEEDGNTEDVAGDALRDGLPEHDETEIDRRPSEDTVHVPSCASCHATLPDLRYDCHVCSGLSFCSRCRKSHSHHALKAMTGPIDDDASLGDSDSDNTGDDVSNRNGSGFALDDVGVGTSGVGGFRESFLDRSLDHGDRSSGVASDTGEAEGSQDLERMNSEKNSNQGSDHDTDEEDSDQEGVSDASMPLQRSKQPQDFLQVSYEDFAQMTQRMTQVIDSMQSMGRAAEEILLTRSTSAQRTLKPAHRRTQCGSKEIPETVLVPKPLLNFPIDLATLNRSEGRRIGSESTNHGRRTSSRQWTPQDRHQLSKLKEKGWTDERIGAVLNRTAGAVSQQWRKQHQ